MTHKNSGAAIAELRANKKGLRTLQLRALAAVMKHEGSTAREMTRLVGDSESGTIRKRLSEIESQGLIVKAGARPCTVTGRRASYYAPVWANITPEIIAEMKSLLGDK